MPHIKLEVVKDLPEGWTPLEMVAVVKCLDEDGDLALAWRSTNGITPWEAVGMLHFATQDAMTKPPGEK